MNRYDRTIAAIIGQLEGLTVKLPAARRQILDDMQNIGPRARCYDGDKISGGGGHGTATEGGAALIGHYQAILDGFDQELDAVTLILRNMAKDCARVLDEAPVKDRCDSGVGMDGYNEPRSEGGWSDPTCTNIPPVDRKTCDACRTRAKRWKRRQEETAA